MIQNLVYFLRGIARCFNFVYYLNGLYSLKIKNSDSWSLFKLNLNI